MKREAGATAQCRISVTERARKPSACERDMLCVHPRSADSDAVAGIRRVYALLFRPAGTGNIINRYRYRAFILSCA